jgi:hypothetical protein
MAGPHVRLAVGCHVALPQTTSGEATAEGDGPDPEEPQPASPMAAVTRQVWSFLKEPPTI